MMVHATMPKDVQPDIEYDGYRTDGIGPNGATDADPRFLRCPALGDLACPSRGLSQLAEQGR